MEALRRRGCAAIFIGRCLSANKTLDLIARPGHCAAHENPEPDLHYRLHHYPLTLEVAARFSFVFPKS